MSEPSNLRDAAEVYLAAFDAWCGKRYDDCDVERAAAIIEADRAELVAEIVAWLRDQWKGRLQSPVFLANEIEAKWGKV